MGSTEQSKPERVTSERPNGGKGSCGTVQSETEERDFVTNLYRFMKERGTPIERIPHLGFKQINLWKIYSIVEGLGGYHSVTARRLWKSVYDELGGSPGSTSAATCTRRHYERLVLPFERQLRGEADKPLPPPKPRRPYRKSQEAGAAHTHSKRKRKPPSPDAQPQSGVYEQCCETGACRPSCPWYDRSCADRPEGRPETQSASDPTSATSACLAPVTPAEVISPLEKKKRVAQASLSAHPPAAPPHVPEDPAERPSVIRLPAPRPRQVSEGSPLPLSSASSVSFSRSPSPYSMSSEDSVTVSTTTTDVSKKGPPPASSAAPPDSPPTPGGSTGICRPLSRYPIAKETARGLHCREVVQVGPLPRATSRHPALKLPLPTAVYPPHPGPNWVPDASGFAALPLRDSWRITTATLHHPPYKHPLQPPHRQLAAADEALAFGRKLHVVPPFRQTDRRARGKPPPAPKPVLAQHPLLLPPITPGFLRGGAGGGEAKHPLHPAFLSAPPLPHGFPLRRLAPTGLYPAAYEPATTLYPCPSHLWHPHPAYSIAGFQPYYPSARL